MNHRKLSIAAILMIFVVSMLASGVSAQDEPITLTMTAWDIATIPTGRPSLTLTRPRIRTSRSR